MKCVGNFGKKFKSIKIHIFKMQNTQDYLLTKKCYTKKKTHLIKTIASSLFTESKTHRRIYYYNHKSVQAFIFITEI